MKRLNKTLTTPKLLDSAAGAARSMCRRPFAIAAAAALPLAFTSPTMAQNWEWDDDEYERDTEAYEYEPDEGWHEEEWYDPSDWFDDEPQDDYMNTYDYEDDDWNWDGDGYYDGYYDGYNDDEYGYDYWGEDWDNRYRDGYTGGYADGYYDNQRDYEFEPYYYIYTTGEDMNRNTTRQRNRDETRRRGDRARSDQSQSSSQMDRQTQGTMQREREMTRKRGTVESISTANLQGVPSNHLLMRVKMQDGDTVLANFGPNMNRNRLPISSGDRITLKGKQETKDGREVLVVHAINTGEQTLRLRGGSQDRQMNRTRDQRNQNRDMNRNQRDQNRGTDRGQNRGAERGQDQRDREGDSTDRAGGQNTVSLSGTLERVQRRDTDVQGYTIYRVQIDGQSHYLAVKSDEANKLQMKQGDRIQLQGQRKTMNGRRVIDVTRIRGQSGADD